MIFDVVSIRKRKVGDGFTEAKGRINNRNITYCKKSKKTGIRKCFNWQLFFK